MAVNPADAGGKRCARMELIPFNARVLTMSPE
jgi:hypothetical protein